MRRLTMTREDDLLAIHREGGHAGATNPWCPACNPPRDADAPVGGLREATADDDAWRRELRRKRAGYITLRALAERVGVDFTYLSKIENGHDRPSRDLIHRLDNELLAGGEIERLFDGLPCSKCGRRAATTSSADAPVGGLDVERLARALDRVDKGIETRYPGATETSRQRAALIADAYRAEVE